MLGRKGSILMELGITKLIINMGHFLIKITRKCTQILATT